MRRRIELKMSVQVAETGGAVLAIVAAHANALSSHDAILALGSLARFARTESVGSARGRAEDGLLNDLRTEKLLQLVGDHFQVMAPRELCSVLSSIVRLG